MTQVQEGPTWDEGVELPRFAPLAAAVTADVVIIGGGLTGLTAAYLLTQAGRRVMLLEKDRLGYGATGLTTAFLTQYIDTELSELISLFGEKAARAVVQSHGAAIEQVEQIVAAEQIACEFVRCPNFIYALTRDEAPAVQSEQAAGVKLGLPMTWHEDRRLPFAQGGYAILERQAKFHPRKYLAGLVAQITAGGGQIFEESEVTALTAETGVRVQTRQGVVQAQQAVVATYLPFDRALYFKKGLYTSYVYEVRVPAGMFPEGIYEDTQNPYYYWRVDRQGDSDRLILGGADHRAQVPIAPEKNYRALAEYLAYLMPEASYEIPRRWRGPIVEPMDGLALIGSVDNARVVYATGFSGNGMTYATLAAQIATDTILGRESEWAALYRATRTPGLRQLLAKGRDYTQEFVGGALKNAWR